MSEKEQLRPEIVKSETSRRPASIAFNNFAGLTTELYWVDFEGDEQLMQVLAPGQSQTVRSFMGHVWHVRDRYSKRLLAAQTVDGEKHAVDIAVDTFLPFDGGGEAAVIFKNVSPYQVTLLRNDGGGRTGQTITLPAGQHKRLQSQLSHVWQFVRDDSDEVGGAFIPAEAPLQYYEIGAGQAGEMSLSSFACRNESALDVDLYWIDEDKQAHRFKGVAPHESVVQKAYAGQTWATRERTSGALLGRYTMGAGETVPAFLISSQGVRSRPGAENVELRLTNETGLAADLYWVDLQGHEQHKLALAPDESCVHESRDHHVWRLREKRTQAEIGLFIAGHKAKQAFSFQLRTRNTRRPTTIAFKNETALTLACFYVDLEGEEHLAGQVTPGATVRFDTAITQPWIIRERRTQTIVSIAFCTAASPELTIGEDACVPRAGQRAVTVRFANTLPCHVDLYETKDDGVRQRSTLAPGESKAFESVAGALWRAKQTRTQHDVAAFMIGDDEAQVLTLPQLSEGVDGIVAPVMFVNRSMLALDLLRMDEEGQEVHRAALAPGDVVSLDVAQNEIWLARDQHSGEVVGVMVSRADRERFTFDQEDISLRKEGAVQPVSMRFINSTLSSIDVTGIDQEGRETVLATLAPDERCKPLATFAGYGFRFRRRGEGQTVDFTLASDAPEQTYTIGNECVRLGARASGLLLQGEVALFAEKHFEGQCWIAGADLDNFQEFIGLDNQVSSIKVGPHTEATIFKDANYAGTDDVIYLDAPDLAQTDVGDDHISSLQLFTTVTSQQTKIRSQTALIEEFRTEQQDGKLQVKRDAQGKLERYSAYQTTIAFPAEIKEVDVWSAEALTMMVGNRRYEIDAVKPARLKPNALGKVVLTIEATGVSVPPLLLRTNAMGERERFFVFPDESVKERLSHLEDNYLWEHREGLGLGQTLAQEDLAQMQQVIQTLADSVQYEGEGIEKRRYLDAGKMAHNSWALDFEGNGKESPILYRPLSRQEAEALAEDAIPVEPLIIQNFFGAIGNAFNDVARDVDRVSRVVVNTVDRSARDVGRTANVVARDIDRAATTVVRDVGRTATTVTRDVGRTVDTAARDVGRTVDTTARDVGRALDTAARDVGRTTETVGHEIARGAETAVRETGRAFEGAGNEIVRGAAVVERDVVQPVVETVTRPMVVTFFVGNTKLSYYVDSAEKAGEVIAFLIQNFGIQAQMFVDEMRQAFDWQGVMAMHHALANSVFQSFGAFTQKLLGMRDIYGGVVAQAGLISPDLINAFDFHANQRGTVHNTPAAPPNELSQLISNADHLEWLISKIFENLPGSEMDAALSVQMDSNLTAHLQQLLFQIENSSQQLSPQAQQVVATVQFHLQQMANNPGNPLPHFSNAMVALAGSLQTLGGGMLQAVALPIVEFVGAVFNSNVMPNLLQAPLSIPVVNDIYREFVGQDLSLVGLVSTLMAIPATAFATQSLGRQPTAMEFAPETIFNQSGVLNTSGQQFNFAGIAPQDIQPTVPFISHEDEVAQAVKAGFYAAVHVLTPLLDAYATFQVDEDNPKQRFFVSLVEVVLGAVAQGMTAPIRFSGHNVRINDTTWFSRPLFTGTSLWLYLDFCVMVDVVKALTFAMHWNNREVVKSINLVFDIFNSLLGVFHIAYFIGWLDSEALRKDWSQLLINRQELGDAHLQLRPDAIDKYVDRRVWTAEEITALNDILQSGVTVTFLDLEGWADEDTFGLQVAGNISDIIPRLISLAGQEARLKALVFLVTTGAHLAQATTVMTRIIAKKL